MIICFAGGGTLGHVIPALSVINYEEFSRKHQIYFIGSSRETEIEILQKENNIKEVLTINMKGLNRKFLGLNIENVKTLKLYKDASKKVKEFYEKIKPDVVIGMGGYVSFIALLSACNLNIKTIMHEQNAVLGLANKLLINRVNKVLLSFDCNDKGIYIGNPRTTEINNKYNNAMVVGNRVLVVGGSNGAEVLNDLVLSSADFFEAHNIQCTLITGKKYYKENKDKINNCSSIINVLEFTNDLSYHILKSKLVISRGGATTISEITALNKPCIYIPSPNVTNDHQRKNVEEIEKKGLGVMLLEKKLTKITFQNNLLNIINNQGLLDELSNNMKNINKDNIIEKFIYEIESINE